MEKVLKKIIPELKKWQSVSGGDINQTFYATDGNIAYFVKYNLNTPTDFFQKEEQGLKFLKKHSGFRIPMIFRCSSFDNGGYLQMEYIKKGIRSSDYYSKFGEKLARMHRIKGPYFGLSENNYIGTLKQINTPADSWAEFYINNRIKPFNDILNFVEEKKYSYFKKQILKKTAHIHPSPLHGDLWSGNHMADDKTEPVLIDPAVYYGDRTMDIAMLELFGSPHPEFYHSYFSVYPQDKHWEFRIQLSTLYPLLVHARLFGGHYKNSAIQLFQKLLFWNEQD